MRSAARSSGRFRATSADTTPTSVTRGDVEALRDEARADEHVEPAIGEGVDDPLRGALALDDVAIEPADAEPREAVPDLALEALRAAAEVADPRRAALRAAGRHRPGAAAVVAAQGLARLVVDERPGAVRAGRRRSRSRGTGRRTRSRGG